MNWSVYSPDGRYMCDIEIGDDEPFNKSQINDVDSNEFNPRFNRYFKNHERIDRETIRIKLKDMGLFETKKLEG